jgi:uroporphyrinogen decarboxylase
MNSRQRVLIALNHQEPDRVPFDCQFGYDAYLKLAKYIGFSEEIGDVATNTDLTVRPSIDFLQELKIDLFYIGLKGGSNEPEFCYGMDQYTDEWGVAYNKIAGTYGISYEAVGHPLAGAAKNDLADYPWPDPFDPRRVDGLEARCHDLLEQTDFTLVGKFSTSIFEQAFMLRGYEQFLIDLVADPDFAAALLDRTTEIAVGMLTAGMRACGRYIHILRLAGDDMGHQRGTILSPKIFRNIIKPCFARLYRHARSMIDRYNPLAKIMAHTDGDVYAFIPDYIEMGLDVLNPVQPLVTNMDHTALKAEFGRDLSFHGGIDIQRLLPFGSVEEVRQGAVKTMQILGKGGGYILAPTHYVQPDVPPENVLALRDAVIHYGQYPLIG